MAQVRVNPVVRTTPGTEVRTATEGGGREIRQADVGGRVRVSDADVANQVSARPDMQAIARDVQRDLSRQSREAAQLSRASEQASQRQSTRQAAAGADVAMGQRQAESQVAAAAAPRSMASSPASAYANMSGYAAQSPLESATSRASAQRFIEEDRTLPNASTRRNTIGEDLIREARQSRPPAPARARAAQVAEDAESVDEAEQARIERVAHTARLNAKLKRSAYSGDSEVKPRNIEKVLGTIGASRGKPNLSTSDIPRSRPSSQKRRIRKQGSKSFGGNGVGTRVYGKVNGLRELALDEVGVGIQEIAAVVDQNPEMLDALISRSLRPEERALFTTTRDMLIGEVADLINESRIEVSTSKAPDNDGPDTQRRILRVLERQQRGVYLHPIMFSMYNADADGDDMFVSLDREVAQNARYPMEQLININGEMMLKAEWLHVSPIVDGYEDGKTARDYVREVILSRWTRLRMSGVTRSRLDAVVDAVIKLSETHDMGTDAQAAAWGDLFRAAHGFAFSYAAGRRSNENARRRLDAQVMNDMVNAVYQGLRSIFINSYVSAYGRTIRSDQMPDPVTPSDEALYRVLDDMVMGHAPNNFQELRVAMNAYLGNVQGQNAPFRFTGNVGKIIKLNNDLRIGSEYVVNPNNEGDMRDFLEATMEYAYAERMVMERKIDGKELHYKDVLRDNVIAEVGFPDRYVTMRDFVLRFAESYNRNAAQINEANTVWLMNMAIDDTASSKSDRRVIRSIENAADPSGEELATPLIEVYGTYSFDRMLGSGIAYSTTDPTSRAGGGTNTLERDWYRSANGKRWIRSKYKLMSLRSFSVNNHIIMEDRERWKYSKMRMSQARSDDDVVDGLLLAIADKRTSTASDFNRKVTGRYKSKDGVRGHVLTTAGGGLNIAGMMQVVLQGIVPSKSAASNPDYMLKVNDAVMALNATGYEMFNALDMDSTAGFMSSEYGEKLLEHAYDHDLSDTSAGNVADVIVGIRESMVMRWQMLGVLRICDMIDMAVEDDSMGLDEIGTLINRRDAAWDELAAKSLVWQGLVSEMRAANPSQSAFAQLQTVEGRKGLHWKAPDFWSSGHEGYSSIRDVMDDLDMPWPLKCDIITDVARWQTQDYQLNEWEVAFQLEVGGDSRFSLNSGARQASLGVFNDAQSEFNNYANHSIENMRREVEDAVALHSGVRGALKKTIHRLATNPWEMTHIDDGMYAEALLAVRDKVYPQTEKAQKHPATNANYSALSLQMVGGYFNDVHRFDDRALGIQPASSLSGSDLAKILDDPSFSLTVYDESGRFGTINQRTLLGIDHDASEQELWNFLVENPRLACMLRSNAVCVSTDVKNRGRLGARLSLAETISSYGNDRPDVLGNIKYLLRDDPVYGGLISMLMPAHHSTTRNERSRAQKIENRVCRELYRSAFEDGEMGASRVLTNLGVTRLKLRTLLTSDWDKLAAKHGFGWHRESVEEVKDMAEAIYSTIEGRVAVYLKDIAEKVPRGAGLSNIKADIDRYGMDRESVASAWDMIQELNGAKIGVSTGIEGKETHDLAYWITHMGAKDRYADLEAIAELIEADDDPSRFDGMWTNKGDLRVEVGEDGNVTTNISELSEMKSHPGDTVVTMVPDGFDIPDRSLDGYGNPVPSLHVALVCKRAKGAEKFNLKAAKSGIDGTFSIVKMKDKYLMEDYGDGTSYPISFAKIRDELASMAASEGISEARAELARRIMVQDQQMGYNDLTLPNYMNMAEMMLVEGEDGQVILRSVEQLSAAAKGIIGVGLEEMTERQARTAISALAADASAGAVGLTEVDDPRWLLDSLRPAGKAGSLASSIRINSSSFQRNYDLLKKIQDDSGGIPMTAGQREELHESIMGIKDIADVWDRCTILRNYHICGFMGAKDGRQLGIQGAGPTGAFVIGDGQVDAEQVKAACRRAYETGTTVVVSNANIGAIPAEFAADMIPVSDTGDMAIHMFDARLNGSEAKPFEAVFEIAKVPASRYVVTAEDPINVYELADAQKKPTRHFLSRTTQHYGDNIQMTAESLFPNVFASGRYSNCDMSVSLASKQLVKDLVCNPDGVRCTIDYGLVEGAEGFGQRRHDVNAAIRRYAQMVDRSNGDTSALMGLDSLAPGDIVAWADLEISGPQFAEPQHVLAPIIPFELHGSTTAPSSYSIVQCGPTDGDGALFSIDWAFDGPIDEHGFVKVFGGGGAANKGMVSLADAEESSMTLSNGMQVDLYTFAESTKGRSVGTDKRIKSLKSLMAAARIEGYNFANVEGSFPNDPDVREALLQNRLPRDFWAARYEAAGYTESPIAFHSDPLINEFLDSECRKIFDNGGDPSDYLATSFEGLNDGQNQRVMWQFECMFDNSLHYEDVLLKYLHMMNPTLCPDGLDDDTSDTLFRLYRDPNGDLGAGFDYGDLQVEVPFTMDDGSIALFWTHVDIDMAFFGQDYSHSSMPNVRGASDLLDSENTAAYYGATLSTDKARKRAAWATSDEGHFVRDGGVIGSAR